MGLREMNIAGMVQVADPVLGPTEYGDYDRGLSWSWDLGFFDFSYFLYNVSRGYKDYLRPF